MIVIKNKFPFWLTSLCIMGSSFIHFIRTDSNECFVFLSSSKGATTFICLPHHKMILAHYPWPSQISTKDLMVLFGMHFLAALCRWLSHCWIDSDGSISYYQEMTSRASSELPGWWHLFPITGSTGWVIFHGVYVPQLPYPVTNTVY